MRVNGGLGGLGDLTPKRVTRTGLAVVHENELVFPAAGSAAEAVAAAADAQAMVQVVFPVEVEVFAGPEDGEAEREAALAVRRAAARIGRIA